jgi:hypothetical protein
VPDRQGYPEHDPLFGPSLPYDRDTSSGWSRTDTSRERAEDRDASGKTADVQSKVLRLANDCGARGITVVEARGHRGLEHHGTCSQALSNLEKDGRLVLLAERRNRAHVYVLPRYAQDRERAPERHRRTDLTEEEQALVLRAEGALIRDPSRLDYVHGDDVRDLIALVRRLAT